MVETLFQLGVPLRSTTYPNFSKYRSAGAGFISVPFSVAALAESINHHPTLTVGWGVCAVRWSTHDTGGLTPRDFDAARQTDLLDPGPNALPDPNGAGA